MNPNKEISQLFELYHDVIYKQCLHMVGYNQQYISLIDDCIQYAFWQAILKKEQFAQCKNQAGWLSVIARRHLMSEIRKNCRRSKITVPWYEQADEDASLQLETDIDRWHSRQEATDCIEQIYEILSTTEKEVFRDYFLQDSSIDEVAENLKISRGAVRGAIDRIRTKAKRLHIFPAFFVIVSWIWRLIRNI